MGAPPKPEGGSWAALFRGSSLSANRLRSRDNFSEATMASFSAWVGERASRPAFTTPEVGEDMFFDVPAVFEAGEAEESVALPDPFARENKGRRAVSFAFAASEADEGLDLSPLSAPWA